jgi:osmotically-inducible protein OsmY
MKHGNRSTIFLAAIEMATTASCSPTSARESAGQHPGDGAVTTRVKAAIFSDPALKSSEIDVETFGGRVQLSGILTSLADIEKAVAVARGVGGVTAVDNGLRLE